SVDHINRISYERDRVLAELSSFLNVKDPRGGHEPLATLGDSLVLSRWTMSASGVARGTFDVGSYQMERIAVIEVDGSGRRTRLEQFAADNLGDAIARLYERYAELLPDGPERDRAAITARSVAAMMGPFDPDRVASTYAPAVEAVDHRILA